MVSYEELFNSIKKYLKIGKYPMLRRAQHDMLIAGCLCKYKKLRHPEPVEGFNYLPNHE